MKKLLLTMLLLLGLSAHAEEVVRIVWGFGPMPAYTSAIRMVEILNTTQSDYKFVLDIKSGAGGSIAASNALQTNSLMMTSNSFIIKGVNATEKWDDSNNFNIVYIQSLHNPLMLISKKYRTMDELMKSGSPNIAVSALGGITDLAARELTKNKAGIVSYKTMQLGLIDTYGGHIDAGIGTWQHVGPFVESQKVFLLDSTSNHSNMKELQLEFFIVAPKTMDKNKVKEFNELFNKVGNSDYVREPFSEDKAQFVEYDLDKSKKWYAKRQEFWKKYLVNFQKKVDK